MRGLIYYAHPVTWYDTPEESDDIGRIARILDARILNPNAPEHSEGYAQRGMSYFFEDVLPQCSACVVRAFRDGHVGAGVWSEATWFARRGIAVLEIDSDRLFPFVLAESRRLDVDGTRARVKAGLQ